MFNLKPIGTYHIELCKTLSCKLCGSKKIKDHIKQTIGIEAGQTSEDGLFHLSEVECMGSLWWSTYVCIKRRLSRKINYSKKLMS